MSEDDQNAANLALDIAVLMEPLSKLVNAMNEFYAALGNVVVVSLEGITALLRDLDSAVIQERRRQRYLRRCRKSKRTKRQR